MMEVADLTSKNITDVLEALIGKTWAVGETYEDMKRLENLRTLIDVTNWCLDGIAMCAEDKHRHEASVRTNGELAYGALLEYDEWLKERIEELG